MITAIIGTRAQLIKMAPVLLELESRGLCYNLLFTGQHQETMQELLQEFGVTTSPTYTYTGPEVSGIARMLTWLPGTLFRLLRRRRQWLPRGGPGPDVVLVHGDTFSTLLGALAGRLAGLRVGHVEAGLRSFHLLHPFPEELTRLLTFRLAHIAYAPGAWACENLQRYQRLQVVNTGANTLLDAVRIAVDAQLPGMEAPGEPYCVASIHRFENIYNRERLEHVVSLLERVAQHYRVVMVLHPATRNRLTETGLLERLEANPGFHLVPRMGYSRFMQLIAGGRFVITDGGSNQEELSYLGIPTLLMRRATERREGLEETAVLCGYDPAVLTRFLAQLPETPPSRPELAAERPARRIVDHLRSLTGPA